MSYCRLGISNYEFSLNCQRFTPTGYKYARIKEFDVFAKTQFLYQEKKYLYIFNHKFKKVCSDFI